MMACLAKRRQALARAAVVAAPVMGAAANAALKEVKAMATGARAATREEVAWSSVPVYRNRLHPGATLRASPRMLVAAMSVEVAA